MKKLFMFASAAALLAGCSQDLTEDLAVTAPAVEGNSTVIVTFAGDETTRTHFGYNDEGKKVYLWDDGDAIGVFAKEVGDNTNATFKYDKVVDNKVSFKGSLEFFDTKEYIVYYPYTPTSYHKTEENKVLGTADSEKLRMNIPATQLYNFDAEKDDKGKDVPGSFAQNTAPSIGIGELDEEGRLAVTLKGAASYMYFPIKGSGHVKKLELSISGVDHLNGYNQVFADIKNPEFGFAAPGSNGTSTTTLNCGAIGVELGDEAKYFWFVVPNLKLQDATITIKVNDNEELTFARTGYTNGANGFKANTYYGILDLDENKKPNKPWYIEIPEEETGDDYVINSPEKFLMYAYAATEGTAKTVPAEMLKDGENLKRGIITTNLEFTEDYEFEAIGSEYRKTVANWYNKEKSIPTIGGAMKFELVGDVKDATRAEAEEDEAEDTPAEQPTEPTLGAPATISGLKVKGNGMFYSGYTGTKQANHVENIVLDGVTVDGDCYLSNILYDDASISFDNVTVSVEGEQPLFGTAYTNNLHKIDGTYTYYAKTLQIIDKAVSFAGPVEGVEDNRVLNADEYVTLNIHTGGTNAYVYVADAAAAGKLLEKLDKNSKPCWSMLNPAKTTSYWTGTVAENASYDATILTAEELAYYAKQGGTYTLTNSIDLMGKEWTASATNATVTVAEGADVTISNVEVTSAYLLAETGTAKGLKVSADYSKAEAVEGYVGGLFLYETAATAAETAATVTVNGAPADATFGTQYGYIKLALNGNSEEVELDCDFAETDGAYVPYGAIVCRAADDVTLAVNGYTNVVFKGENVNLDDIEKHIVWDWAADARIPNGYKLTLKTSKGNFKDVPYTFTVNNDETLAEAISSAEQGKTVEVPAGEFSTPDLSNVAEGVSIKGKTNADGTPATVFDGEFKNENGVTITNVKFTYTEAENAPQHTHSSGKTWHKAIMDGVEVKGNYTNCVFEGYSAIYNCTLSENVTFTGCKFIANEYNNSWALNFNLASGASNVVAKFVNCEIDGWFGLGTLNPENDAYAYVFENCKIKVNENSKRGGGNFYCNTSFDMCTFIGFPTAQTISKATNGQWLAMQDEGYAPFTLNFNNCKIGEEEHPLTVLSLMNNKEIVFYNEDSTNRVIVDGSEYNFINKYDASKYTE